MERAIDVAAVRYDRDGDQHYDVISAFIKSMRGSDVDASLHYLARMIAAGEDPRFIARRIVIAAAEDVGMADPSALQTAVAAAQAVALIGMPEARIILAEAVVHLATAPKSNAAYLGIDRALADVRAGRIGSVPPHLRDAHYPGAETLGHGTGYVYAHDEPHARRRAAVPARRAASGTRYYEPTRPRLRAPGRRAAGAHPRDPRRAERPSRAGHGLGHRGAQQGRWCGRPRDGCACTPSHRTATWGPSRARTDAAHPRSAPRPSEHLRHRV